jgi:hypothetical protein
VWTDSDGELLESRLFPFTIDDQLIQGASTLPGSSPIAILWDRIFIEIWNHSCQISAKSSSVWRLVICRLGDLSDLEGKAWDKIFQARLSTSTDSLAETEPPLTVEAFTPGGADFFSSLAAATPGTIGASSNLTESDPFSLYSHARIGSGDRVHSVTIVSIEVEPWLAPHFGHAQPFSSAAVVQEACPKYCACQNRARILATGLLVPSPKSMAPSAPEYFPLRVSLYANDSSRVHPISHQLSSTDHHIVLSFVLEQFDALSWLTADLSNQGRRSNLPLHCVTLSRFITILYDLTAERL